MSNKIIFFSFAILFAFTPLFWTPWNYELFEYNKMILTYFLTILICGAWIWRMVDEKQFIFKVTPLHIPLGLFFIANVLSTIYSIDQHTSIWGYYSRSNGGLLSITAYLLLFCAFVSNITKEQTVKLLKVALAGGFAVALWAIPEHFGVSPSCIILHGDFNANCWIQDVQARVFASLGQPNWLGAYMAMLIFPALYFFLNAQEKQQQVTSYLLLVTYYLALTFTFSRGATLGFLAGIGLFLGLLFFERQREVTLKTINISKEISHYVRKIKPLFLVIASFVIINLIFGSALTRFQLTNLLSKPQPVKQEQSVTTLTQLESGGTESGQIRLIVWAGALDIFKNYPLFGSGVETFAYSYYQFRPTAHNLVSEWDFLYNKAHNEFLNYLATTGIAGFSSYSIIIITFIIVIFKKLKINPLLLSAFLASYISYLVQNIFGFSVVIIAIFFYLFPAFAFVLTDSTKSLKLSKFSFFNFIYYRPIYIRMTKGFVLLVTCYLLFVICRLWYADRLFAIGQRADEAGNPGKAYNYLSEAVSINKGEPFYRSELGYASAASAVALAETDATLSAHLKEEAIAQTELALQMSPANVSFWTTAVRTYYQLSVIDEIYIEKTLQALDQATKLSPTNPKLYYNKAIIFDQLNEAEDKNKKENNAVKTNNKKAIAALQKAVELKPNYREGYFALALFLFDNKQQKEAVEIMGKVLQLVPNDQGALKQLEEWGKQGIATNAAQVTSDK